MTGIRLALAAALFVGASAPPRQTASHKLANRYPGYAAPGAQAQALRSDPHASGGPQRRPAWPTKQHVPALAEARILIGDWRSAEAN